MNTVKNKKSEKKFEYENKYFAVYSQEVNFGDFTKKYYVHQNSTKACLMIVDGDSILLARQYRFIVDRPIWEIPGGKVEEGEDPGQSAIRECEEETGIQGVDVKPLLNYQQGVDSLSAPAKLFYTREFKKTSEFKPDPAEVDMIKWFPFDECMEMVRLGEIIDHFTIIALLYFQYINRQGVRG